MKVSVLIAFLAAAAWSAQIAAQTSGSSTRSQSGQQNTITVTGCLQSGGQMSGSTGTTGSTSGTTGSSASGRFMLTNAHTDTSASGTTSRPGSTSTGTSTAGSSTAGTSGSTYILEGKTNELQPHANHEVQITGRLSSTSSSGSPSGTSSTGSTTSGTSSTGSRTSGSENAQHLMVESVKMISSTCTQK